MIFIDNQKRTDIYLKDYYLSDDNKFMNIEVGVSSSAGYVRKIKNRIKGDKNYCIFYSTYGINSKMGAKDKFKINLNNDISEIYFYEGNNNYKLILVKDEFSQEWKKITNDIKIHFVSVFLLLLYFYFF